MPRTLATLRDILVPLLPLAQWLASVPGAGYAASRLLDIARQHLPLPPAGQPASLCRRLLWAPRYARLLSIASAGAVSALATLALVVFSAWLQGAPFDAPLLDMALAAALAALAAQIRHGLSLAGDVPGSPAHAEAALRKQLDAVLRMPQAQQRGDEPAPARSGPGEHNS